MDLITYQNLMSLKNRFPSFKKINHIYIYIYIYIYIHTRSNDHIGKKLIVTKYHWCYVYIIPTMCSIIDIEYSLFINIANYIINYIKSDFLTLFVAPNEFIQASVGDSSRQSDPLSFKSFRTRRFSYTILQQR